LTHSRSAEKRVRQAEESRLRNRSIRGATRTQIRKALPLIAANRLDEAQGAVRQAVSALDKAAEKGVIHPNNAARHKSRLMLKYNSAVSAAATAAAVEPAAKPARGATKKAAPAKAPARATAKSKATAKTTAKKPAKKPAAKKPASKSKSS
jgi:small subunit ribosomal protein S20